MDYIYDVAMSFAGEQRDYVERVSVFLKEHGVSVYYDKDREVAQWGKDLYQTLHDLYKNKALYTVIFVSADYAEKMWPRHELRAAQERALSDATEYILPARFDDTKIPGLPATIAYMDLRKTDPPTLGETIISKLQQDSRFDKKKIRSPQESVFVPKTWGDTVVYSHKRFVSAFPEVVGTKSYTDPKEILYRLSLLLSGQMLPKTEERRALFDSIWWWRGHRNMQIEHFAKLSDERCLINDHELRVSNLVAVNSGEYFQSFIYLQTDAEPPTGVYEWSDDEIAKNIREFGFCREETGLFDGKYYTRTEYDNGHGVKDGRVINFNRLAELRLRYLTTFNMVIAGKAAPINATNEVDELLEDLMNGILRNTNTVEELVEIYLSLPSIHKKYAGFKI